MLRGALNKLSTLDKFYRMTNFIDYTLSFFTRKKRNQKALVTASRSVATDYFPSTRSLAKNDKTPYGQTMPFFNAHSLLAVNAADATNSSSSNASI